MGEKGTNLGLAHVIGVAFMVKEDESLYPMPVSLFSSQAIVLQANDVSNLIDEFGRTQSSPQVSLPRKVTELIVDIVDRAVLVNLNRCTNGGSIDTAFHTMTSCSGGRFVGL
jgi:hypothetical protein